MMNGVMNVGRILVDYSIYYAHFLSMYMQCNYYPWLELAIFNAPINGMPHLAYLGQMLVKYVLPSESSPKRLVLNQDCPNPL